MKNLYFLVTLLFCGVAAIAQNKNNHWLLGLTDINFSTNPPIANTVSGGASTKYGIATISDSNGALLFYTDGKTVWNKNHQVMENGNLISENPESLQQAIIVPHPGNSNLYYIFRSEAPICSCYDEEDGGYSPTPAYYVYSMVDFSTNSLGKLLEINDDIYIYPGANIYTKTLSGMTHYFPYSPLTFTVDSSGSNYWVIVQEENSLLSYKIDEQGLNTVPVSSSFQSDQVYDIGYFDNQMGRFNGISNSIFRVVSIAEGTSKLYGLQSSSQYKNSSDPAYHGHRFYAVDFNNTTGQFYNYQSIIIEGNGGVAYNFELSPDLQKAYFTTYLRPYSTSGNEGQIIVKDLSNISTPSRTLYEYSAPTVASSKFYNIQKDKYSNIVVSGKSSDLNRNKYLHIINNPNSFSGSTIKINNLYLNGNIVGVLPQLFPKIGCTESLFLNTTETVNKSYKVSNTITTNTNYVVNGGVIVTLKAENAIYLEPNTDIMNGATFNAYIEMCSYGNTSSDRMSSYFEDENNTLELIQQNFVMYPNPSDNITTLSMSDDVIKSISVYSLDGRTVFSKDIMEKEYSLDVNNYPKGMYMVNVETLKGETFTKKLIKN